MTTITYIALTLLQRKGILVRGEVYYTENGIFRADNKDKFSPYSTQALTDHITSLSNPHGVTKSQVGLGSVDNTSDQSKPISLLQQSAINDVNNGLANHLADVANPHNVTKAQVGLSNADNTSDLGKPISTATQTALNAKLTASSNLSDLTNASTARTNIGLNTTANQVDSTNKRFVSDAQLTVISNTSGTNTGDQNLAPYLTSATAASTYQPLDSDLTTLAGLTATTDNFIVSVASTWASRTPAQVKSTLSLNSVENTALSTWAGTANITTLGTIGTGTWNATVIADGKIASALTGKTYNGVNLTTAGSATDFLNAQGNYVAGGGGTGDVVGPAISVDNRVVFFDGVTGKLIKDSGITLSGSNTGDQSTIAQLTTPRAIGGVNFDGTADIVPQTIQSVNEATDTTCFPLFITASGSQSLQPRNNAGFIYNSNTNSLTATTFIGALTGTASGNLVSGGALGTPSSGTLSNCTFPTLNQDTTGSAGKISVSGQSGLISFTGITSTSRIKTVRDAADTILELGGSYTPTGTWTSLTMVTPVLGTPTSGNLANCTFPTLNQNTSGTAANVSGTPALPNGTTATTQTQADNSTKLSTTAYVDTGLATKAPTASPTFTGTVTLPAAQAVNGVTLKTDQGAAKWLDGTGAYTTPTAAAANQNPNLLVQAADYNLAANYGMTVPYFYELSDTFTLDIAVEGVLDII
jgi:hypothetical protein